MSGYKRSKVMPRRNWHSIASLLQRSRELHDAFQSDTDDASDDELELVLATWPAAPVAMEHTGPVRRDGHRSTHATTATQERPQPQLQPQLQLQLQPQPQPQPQEQPQEQRQQDKKPLVFRKTKLEIQREEMQTRARAQKKHVVIQEAATAASVPDASCRTERKLLSPPAIATSPSARLLCASAPRVSEMVCPTTAPRSCRTQCLRSGKRKLGLDAKTHPRRRLLF